MIFLIDFYLFFNTFAFVFQFSDAWGGGFGGGFGGRHGGGYGGGHGGWGGGGFHSGYGHQGYGYGSCAGAQQRPGGGGFHPQPISRPQSSGFDNNGGYYEPMTMNTPYSMEQQNPIVIPPRKTNFDYRINLPANRVCSLPKTRDSTVFSQECIFPNESKQEFCSSRGTTLPTGTTAITSCKSPEYFNDNGDMMLEICKDGKWHGDGNTLTCKSNVVVTQPSRASPYPSPDNVVQYVQQPKVGQQPVPSKDIIQVPVPYKNDPYQQPNWAYNQNQPVPNQPSQPIITQIDEPSTVPVSDPKSSLPYYWTNNENRIPTTNSQYYKPLPQQPPPPTTTTTTTTSTTTTPTTTTTTTTTQRPYYLEQKIDWRQYTKTAAPTINNSYNFGTEINYNKNGEVKCPPLIPKPGMILECLSKSTKNPAGGAGYTLSFSNCEEHQPIGTEGTYKCQMYFESANGLTTQYRKCKENGVWSGNDDFGCRLECGKSNPGGRLPLITFGEMTILGQWPWHASVFKRGGDRGGNDFANVCGGTLISSRAVLTAAHCVTLHLSSLLRELNDVRVDLGRYYRDKDDAYVQKFKVDKIVIHPAYNPYIFESDIAIIILKETARIGFHVRPICFPKAQNAAFDEMQLSDGSHATVVGFGVDENGESPDELRSAKIKIIGYRECIESFEEADTGALLAKSTTFCAGNKNGTNVCRGDSGSGAYFAIRTSTGATSWYLQGIVSLGINISADDKKCDPEKVSIFTRVSPYADWIVRVLSENDAM